MVNFTTDTNFPIIFFQRDGVIIKKLGGFNKVGSCGNKDVIFASDSKHVAICDDGIYKIFDLAGNRTAEVPNEEINSLIPILPSKLDSSQIDAFNFSPDGRKIFFIYRFTSDTTTDYTFMEGKYAFMGDVGGKNIKKISIVDDGIKKIDLRKGQLVEGIVGSTW